MENWQRCLKAFLERLIGPTQYEVWTDTGITTITTPWKPPVKTRNRGVITVEKIEEVFSLFHTKYHNFFKFEIEEEGDDYEAWILSLTHRC
jgi:SHS2 domain-containing protein